MSLTGSNWGHHGALVKVGKPHLVRHRRQRPCLAGAPTHHVEDGHGQDDGGGEDREGDAGPGPVRNDARRLQQPQERGRGLLAALLGRRQERKRVTFLRDA